MKPSLHFLQELDGKRKYVFTTPKNQNLYLRVVTSGEKIQECMPSIALSAVISENAMTDLYAGLAKSGQHPTNPAKFTAEGTAQRIARRQKNAVNDFDKGNNFTFFIVEDENRVPVLTMFLTMNSPVINEQLQLGGKNNIFFEGVIIDKNLRNQGIAKQSFNEIFATICEFAGKKFNAEAPLEIIAPVGSAEIVDSANKVTEHLIHAETYITMFQYLCGDNVSLQSRLRNDDDQYIRGERILGSKITSEIITAEMQKVRKEMVQKKEQEGATDVGIGMFVIGVTPEKILENFTKQKAAVTATAVEKGVITIDPKINPQWEMAGPQNPRPEIEVVSAAAFTKTPQREALQ